MVSPLFLFHNSYKCLTEQRYTHILRSVTKGTIQSLQLQGLKMSEKHVASMAAYTIHQTLMTLSEDTAFCEKVQWWDVGELLEEIGFVNIVVRDLAETCSKNWQLHELPE